MVKDWADKLEKHYPGWMWTINPDEPAGMVYLYSLRLSGEWGYQIKITDMQDDPGYKKAIEAGGAILERFGLKRGAYKREDLQNKITDLRGNFMPDITDHEARERKQVRDREVTKAYKDGKIKFRTRDISKPDGSTYRELHMQIGSDDDSDTG